MSSEPQAISASETLARLKASERIVITTHTRADGDAVGSIAALQGALRRLGKHATAYLHEPILDRYAYLGALEAMSVWEPQAAPDILGKADLVVVADTCASVQLGKMAEHLRAARVRKIAIDHHITRDDIVDEILLDDTAGACCQIILHLFEEAGWEIDAATATMLYTGIATDTGWFRFSNSDEAAFAAAGRLVALGAKPNELYERLYHSDCEARLRLIGELLSTFELHAAGRLAVLRITRDMLKRCGATREMTEEVVNEPMRMGDVVASLLLVEPEGDAPVRMSFRSKCDIDVAQIAAQFGGGGHARAAGARMAGTLASAAEAVIPVMVRAMEAIP